MWSTATYGRADLGEVLIIQQSIVWSTATYGRADLGEVLIIQQSIQWSTAASLFLGNVRVRLSHKCFVQIVHQGGEGKDSASKRERRIGRELGTGSKAEGGYHDHDPTTTPPALLLYTSCINKPFD